jgi:superfamily II DNA or RNA helicase
MEELYNWQILALQQFMDNHNLIAEVATGAGKSKFAIECIKKVWTEHPNYNVLIVVPKVVILEDTWIRELNKNDITFNNIGIYYNFAKEYSRITLTTTSSVKKIPLEVFDFVIFDEVHNMTTPALMNVVKHDWKYKLGLSASLYKENQKHWKLMEVFDWNVFKYGTKKAIDDKIINNFIFESIGVEILDEDVKLEYESIEKNITFLLEKIGGFHNYERLPNNNPNKLALQKLFNKRNNLIMNYHRKIELVCNLISKNIDKKIIVFNQYNKISNKLFWGLTEYGIKSRIMNSDVKPNALSKILRDYRNNRYNVLLTTRMTDEGYNLPDIDLAIIFSGNSTDRQIIQRIGRVLRKKNHHSVIYQVFVKDTFEQRFANKRVKLLEGVADRITARSY